MKAGNHLSRKSLQRDKARMAGSAPAGRTALPKPVVPETSTWWYFAGFWAVVILGVLAFAVTV